MDRQREYQEYISEILGALKTIKIKTILVFGSYVSKTLDENSDLDLLIVLDEKQIPKNYDEKMELKLHIRRALREINRKVAIDILVYTIPEYEIFINSGSSFSKELLQVGETIYEKAS